MIVKDPALKGESWGTGVSWLLSEGGPSIRYWTFRDLLGYDEDDMECVKARNQIPTWNPVATILAEEHAEGYWGEREDVYWPKWRATVWPLILLAEFGVPEDEPGVKRACEYYLKTMDGQDRSWPMLDHPEGDMRGYRSVWEPCVTGNMARTLVQFGYGNDPRVEEMFRWLVSTQYEDGGWNCDQADRKNIVKHGSFMSTIEPLWAFSSLDATRWPKGGKEAVARGCEFLLTHRLYKSDHTFQVINEEWTKLHFPLFYLYDILHGLRVLSALGYLGDKRTYDAIGLLKSKHLGHGRWPLESSYARAIKGNLVKDGSEWKMVRGEDVADVPKVYDELGKIGEANPWITLNALRVLGKMEQL